MPDAAEAARAWWTTEIVEIEPGVIRMRGYEIQDLVGRVSFAEQIWLMLRGELPSRAEGRLLEAALVAAVDHGPQAPSIAIARMSATCGMGLNNAMAAGVNALGDVHGGAGQQAMALYEAVGARAGGLQEAARAEIADRLAAGRMIEGFGHRFHPVDPRAGRLLALIDEAASEGAVSGRFAAVARAVEDALAALKGKRLPMNIDGATAAVFAELGFPPALGRGLFVLSRSVGVLAHAWEQTRQGGRIKGPVPPSVGYAFAGRPRRPFPERHR